MNKILAFESLGQRSPGLGTACLQRESVAHNNKNKKANKNNEITIITHTGLLQNHCEQAGRASNTCT